MGEDARRSTLRIEANPAETGRNSGFPACVFCVWFREQNRARFLLRCLHKNDSAVTTPSSVLVTLRARLEGPCREFVLGFCWDLFSCLLGAVTVPAIT